MVSYDNTEHDTNLMSNGKHGMEEIYLNNFQVYILNTYSSIRLIMQFR